MLFLHLVWVNVAILLIPSPQTSLWPSSTSNAFYSNSTIDDKQAVIQQIKALGLSPMWYSAQYEALLEGTIALAGPSTSSLEQNATDDIPLEYVLHKDLVFSPNYRGIVFTPGSGWYHFQSKTRLKKATSRSNLSQQVPVGLETPVFVAGGAVLIQESPSTARYHEYNVHIFNGARGERDWYEVDSLSIASSGRNLASDNPPKKWHFETLAVPGGYQITTHPQSQHSGTAKRFAYHIHGLDRRPDSITANGKNIVYIYLPETQSVIFKLSAGEHILLVRYP